MIVEVFEWLGGWAWWVLGLILLAADVLLPGFFLIWFGIAAILIGISALLIDWPWQMQVLGFVVLSGITAMLGRRFFATAAHRHTAHRHHAHWRRRRNTEFLFQVFDELRQFQN